MTESKWLACGDPDRMLEFLGRKASERKQRLLACACCRLMWHNFADPRSKAAVETAERIADEGETAAKSGQEGAEAVEVFAGQDSAMSWDDFLRLPAAERVERNVAVNADSVTRREDGWAFHYHLQDVIERTLQMAKDQTFGAKKGAVALAVAGLMRDVIAHPSRPITLPPEWITPTVGSLAEAAYVERLMPSGRLNPGRLAVLSDALEEAGCTNADLLAHLRSAGPHVRGCWALDLILGKE